MTSCAAPRARPSSSRTLPERLDSVPAPGGMAPHGWHAFISAPGSATAFADIEAFGRHDWRVRRSDRLRFASRISAFKISRVSSPFAVPTPGSAENPRFLGTARSTGTAGLRISTMFLTAVRMSARWRGVQDSLSLTVRRGNDRGLRAFAPFRSGADDREVSLGAASSRIRAFSPFRSRPRCVSRLASARYQEPRQPTVRAFGPGIRIRDGRVWRPLYRLEATARY